MNANVNRLLAVAVLMMGACNTVFGLEDREPTPDAAPDAALYSRCGTFLFDEALRYATINNPRTAPDGVTPLPWSWDEARTMCQQRGMDLAVFNDEHELGMANEPPAWPYWIGAKLTNQAWENVDECPALEPATPSAMTNGCGVVNGPVELGATACTGALPVLPDPIGPPVVPAALCETPRPTTANCLGNDPAATRYVRSIQPLDYAGAKEFCDNVNGEIVVFETHEEWKRVSKLTNEQFKARFWIGSQFDGTVWSSITNCPATYSWKDGTPGTPVAGSCLSSTLRVDSADNPEHQGIWLDGLTPTACDQTDELFAVCEIR